MARQHLVVSSGRYRGFRDDDDDDGGGSTRRVLKNDVCWYVSVLVLRFTQRVG